MTQTPATKTVLVTGGGKRIGRALCLNFAQAGWTVRVHYNRSAEAAQEVVEMITAGGGNATAVTGNLADIDGPDQIISGALTDGNLDLLVNSASVFHYDQPAAMDSAIWTETFAVNLRAPMRLAELFYQHAKSTGNGLVVNILDNGVNALTPDYYTYMVAKSGLKAATQMMAMRFAPEVRIGGIAPGLTLISGDQTAAEFDADHRRNPLQQGCQPNDIARAISFMFETASMTGQVITIDGGLSMTGPARDVAFIDQPMSTKPHN